MNTAGTLLIPGMIKPQIIPTVFTQGWYLIGCPFQLSTALSNYFNPSNCSIIKSFDGFWIPNGTNNSIFSLDVGKGYYLKK